MNGSLMIYQSLLDHIRRYVDLEPSEIEVLCSFLSHRYVAKKTFLLEPGKVCAANYFISSGCLRLFFITTSEQEQITHFGLENWWIADYGSLTSQRPSQYYIQAVEDTEIIELKASVQDELLAKVPKLERYFRLVLLRAYTASQRRIEFMNNLSGEDRYNQFTAMFPDFAQRVPLYMLASYLGFTPQFLSKIRAKRN